MNEKTKFNLVDKLPTVADLWTIDQILESLRRAENISIARALEWMRETGTQVSLSWGDGEDWVCLFMIRDDEYIYRSANIRDAIHGILLTLKERMEANESRSA